MWQLLVILALFFFPNFVKAQSLEETFTVTTVKTTEPPKPKDIVLLFPPHKCTMSSGIVTFEWNLMKKIKNKKIELIIEETEKNKRLVLKAKDNKRKHYVDAGIYRWRVVDAKSKVDSKWRVFKVVSPDRMRSLSSVRVAKFIRFSPELPDFDTDDNDDASLPRTIDHLPVPTETEFKKK